MTPPLDIPALLALAADARKLADAATEGPWRAWRFGPEYRYNDKRYERWGSVPPTHENAALIAASRSLVPALADAVTLLTGRVAELEAHNDLCEKENENYLAQVGLMQRGMERQTEVGDELKQETRKLAGRVAELEAALKPFAECGSEISPEHHDEIPVFGLVVDSTVGDCRHAAAVMSKQLR